MSSEIALTNQRARIQTLIQYLYLPTQTLISSDGKVPSRSLEDAEMAGRPVSFTETEAQQIGYIMFLANLTMLATYLGSHGFILRLVSSPFEASLHIIASVGRLPGISNPSIPLPPPFI